MSMLPTNEEIIESLRREIRLLKAELEVYKEIWRMYKEKCEGGKDG